MARGEEHLVYNPISILKSGFVFFSNPLALLTPDLRYYYNGETQESVWEKPQELKDWEVDQVLQPIL